MRNQLNSAICGTAFTLAASGVAFAADMAVKAPPPPPEPQYNWTGFYAGFNFGGGWGTSNSPTTTSTASIIWAPADSLESVSGSTATAHSGVPGLNQSGPIGGGQVGYNWQFAPRFVFGLEADIQGAAITGVGDGTSTASFGAQQLNIFKSVSSANSVESLLANFTNPALSASGSDSVTADVNWLGTVRARLGYLVTPNLLLYATGGLAYGGVSASDSLAITNFNLSADSFVLAYAQATGPFPTTALSISPSAPLSASSTATTSLTSAATAVTTTVASATAVSSSPGTIQNVGTFFHGGTSAAFATNSSPTQSTASYSQISSPLAAAIAASSQNIARVSDTRVGGSVGGGFEWMMAPNWSFKAEAIYYDLGSVTVSNTMTSSVNILTATSPFGPNGPASNPAAPLGAINKFVGPTTVSTTTATRVNFQGFIVRIGLNYHFNWLGG
jgi:opacity protein-like surface antigen